MTVTTVPAEKLYLWRCEADNCTYEAQRPAPSGDRQAAYDAGRNVTRCPRCKSEALVIVGY